MDTNYHDLRPGLRIGLYVSVSVYSSSRSNTTPGRRRRPVPRFVCTCSSLFLQLRAASIGSLSSGVRRPAVELLADSPPITVFVWSSVSHAIQAARMKTLTAVPSWASTDASEMARCLRESSLKGVNVFDGPCPICAVMSTACTGVGAITSGCSGAWRRRPLREGALVVGVCSGAGALGVREEV